MHPGLVLDVDFDRNRREQGAQATLVKVFLLGTEVGVEIDNVDIDNAVRRRQGDVPVFVEIGQTGAA